GSLSSTASTWASRVVGISAPAYRGASSGGLDVELFQLAELRAVLHREAVAEVEQVLVLEAGVVLDLPPVVIEVLHVERIHPVLHHHGQDLADLVLVLVLERVLACLVDLFL